MSDATTAKRCAGGAVTDEPSDDVHVVGDFGTGAAVFAARMAGEHYNLAERAVTEVVGGEVRSHNPRATESSGLPEPSLRADRRPKLQTRRLPSSSIPSFFTASAFRGVKAPGEHHSCGILTAFDGFIGATVAPLSRSAVDILAAPQHPQADNEAARKGWFTAPNERDDDAR